MNDGLDWMVGMQKRRQLGMSISCKGRKAWLAAAGGGVGVGGGGGCRAVVVSTKDK